MGVVVVEAEGVTHCVLLQEIQIGFGFTFLVPAHLCGPGQNSESHKTVIMCSSSVFCWLANRKGIWPAKTSCATCLSFVCNKWRKKTERIPDSPGSPVKQLLKWK